MRSTPTNTSSQSPTVKIDWPAPLRSNLDLNLSHGSHSRLYARCLSSSGEAEALRFLVDALLNDSGSNGDFMVEGSDQNVPSFLSVGINRLGLDGKQIIRQTILPEMSKNRHMQRLTNEISIELDNF